jgi:hypothetical protein
MRQRSERLLKGGVAAVATWTVAASLAGASPPDPSGQSGDPGRDSPEVRFVVANTLWTLVHELGHALIAELEVPILGSEEDAADCIATIGLLHGSADFGIPNQLDEIEFIVATAEAWRVEWELERLHRTVAPYADTHSLDIQRFYNILCLLYGSDPERYGTLTTTLGLPYDRALGCAEYEHEQALRGVNYLITKFGPIHQDAPESARIKVVYEQPLDERRARVADIVRVSRVAELAAEQTERLFVLPKQIEIVFMNCLGQETAFWRGDRKEIVFCYELLERFEYLFRAKGCLEDGSLGDEALRMCLAR